jgi:hypothetical protein
MLLWRRRANRRRDRESECAAGYYQRRQWFAYDRADGDYSSLFRRTGTRNRFYRPSIAIETQPLAQATDGNVLKFQAHLPIHSAIRVDHFSPKAEIMAGRQFVHVEHPVLEQVAERQIVRVVVDRHGGDDFLVVQKDRQRALDRDRGGDRRAGLVNAVHTFRQPRILRIGPDQIVVARNAHAGQNVVSGRGFQGAGRRQAAVGCTIFFSIIT